MGGGAVKALGDVVYGTPEKGKQAGVIGFGGREQKQSEKAVQDLTDRYIKTVDSITSAKEKEILSL